MRIFVAIDISDELREDLADAHIRSRPHFRAVAPKNIHLTLKFLSHAEPEWVQDQLEKLVFNPFTLTTTKFGAFGDRTFWLGVEQNIHLHALFDQVELLLVKKYPKQTREFHPHITVARAKNASAAPGAFEEFKNHKLKRSWEVNEVKIFSSDLTDTGREYKLLKTVRAQK